ncbi:hypothetical protein BKA65DRAFT_475719 [Rhexocercosporidium sp. MPI-PUGE-AT-0058]|nr:hypothetical protein BKA65DRAFT_475719 [Rhexocercosporidium sp. MPI-PUGE-AT-0058]
MEAGSARNPVKSIVPGNLHRCQDKRDAIDHFSSFLVQTLFPKKQVRQAYVLVKISSLSVFWSPVWCWVKYESPSKQFPATNGGLHRRIPRQVEPEDSQAASQTNHAQPLPQGPPEARDASMQLQQALPEEGNRGREKELDQGSTRASWHRRVVSERLSVRLPHFSNGCQPYKLSTLDGREEKETVHLRYHQASWGQPCKFGKFQFADDFRKRPKKQL